MITYEQYNILLERVECLEDTISDLKSAIVELSDKIDILYERERLHHGIIIQQDPCPESFFRFNRDLKKETARMSLEPVSVSGDQKIITEHQYDGHKTSAIVLNEGIEEIGRQGIRRCDNITELIIPSSVRKIGYLPGIYTVADGDTQEIQ